MNCETTQICKRKDGMRTSPRGGFVKITHPESGIAVTKYSVYQVDARTGAEMEMDRLLKIWKGVEQ